MEKVLYQCRKVSIFVGLVLMLVIVSGCSKGSGHVTVKRNGSIEMAVNLRLDARTQSLLSNKIDSLVTKLQAAGINLQKNQEGSTTEYQYLKTYASIQELRSMMKYKDSEWVDVKVKTTDKWLYTGYAVETQLYLSSYSDKILDEIGTTSIPKPLIRLLMQAFAFDFSLTLPFNVYGDNNAAVQDGRTLTWHIKLTDSDPIRMVIYVPNLKNIAIAAGAGVILAGGIVFFFVRKKRLRKSKSC
ncbi:MAG: hypothetical protein K6T94_13495 [Paenibacillus sp.]|nr:hypothetical protein [Paenibacillus sp.]